MLVRGWGDTMFFCPAVWFFHHGNALLNVPVSAALGGRVAPRGVAAQRVIAEVVAAGGWRGEWAADFRGCVLVTVR